MNKTILLFLFFTILILSDFSFAQETRVYGRVFMPAEQNRSRTFRGRIYRNRLVRQVLHKQDENKRSAIEDVIIAAYPLSYDTVAAPLAKAQILQKNAEFIPNVLPITPGTKVDFVNLDKFYHNVFSITPGQKFNIGRRPTGTVVPERITKTGFVKLFCDIHSQMNATIVTLKTPIFTQANKNGVYLFKNLRPGTYRLEAIHPDFDKVSSTIRVEKNKDTEESFTLTR
ncbi:MAG: hypothetical protein H6627_00655 [Calditrichae bacterium]|nr:hypothetical protein [Calditrichota bacterium]MCB9057046.1 hypothetical protein [Calditrichia bacterium]